MILIQSTQNTQHKTKCRLCGKLGLHFRPHRMLIAYLQTAALVGKTSDEFISHLCESVAFAYDGFAIYIEIFKVSPLCDKPKGCLPTLKMYIHIHSK